MSNPFEKQVEVPLVRVEIEPDFVDFAPQEFKDDPFRYFHSKGINVKETVKGDVDKVKDLPAWKSDSGEEIGVLGKQVAVEKAEIGKSGDPFYEYELMKKIRRLGLPCAKPIAKATQGNRHIIFMEKVEGFRTTTIDKKRLAEAGISEADLPGLVEQAKEMIAFWKTKFEAAGFFRAWRAKDMVYQIDPAQKKILGLVPTDWERTKFDKDIYAKALEAQGLEHGN